MAVVRPFEERDLEACLSIVRGLPDFFTPDVPDTIRGELPDSKAWVVEDGGIVGFAVARERWASAAEITWAAVRDDVRNRGYGRTLVEAVLDELTTSGIRVVEVKTLDQSAGYEPYTATRTFWEHRGFVQVDMIDPLPGWQPGNPSAIYVAALGPTR